MQTELKGFSLVELIVALFIFMAILAGVLTLVGADQMHVKLERRQKQLLNVAESELNRLQTLPYDHPDLSTEAVHTADRISALGRKVQVQWTVLEEESGSERVKIKAISLVPYFADNPVKSRVYSGRIYAYTYETP